jgi:hypothetical protein
LEGVITGRRQSMSPSMMKLPNLAGFEGLIDLDRRGVDIRPTLLRVLTDQYLHRRIHTPDEERQYTELTLRLLDETDVPARTAVATRLAAHANAPRAIILRLARDVLTVAEPVLRSSPQLAPADLDAIARERGPTYAAIIAERASLQPAPQAASRPSAPSTATRPSQAQRSAPQQRQAPALSPGRTDDNTKEVSAAVSASTPDVKPGIQYDMKPDMEAKELCGLFFAADSLERRLILISLEFLPTAAPALPVAMQQADIWRFESSALQHKTEAVLRELERALGISRRTALRIVEDDRGEPIVAAAKAMELPADVLQRILLFMNPRVGQSVDRVYELAGLYADITVDAALRLIGIWRDADPPEVRTAKHAALWQDAVEQARTALSDITRRVPTPRRESPAVRPGDRAFGTERR